jgi:hypothetical protein
VVRYECVTSPLRTLRANLHWPHDEPTMRVAVAELRSRGLTSQDIGRALGLHPAAVHHLLGDSPNPHRGLTEKKQDMPQ